MNYKDFNDNELLSYIKENSEEANELLYDKYRPLIEKNARRLKKYCGNTGIELNDLVQEGMIGLSKAINTFNDSKETSFYTYAKTCIERTQITFVVGSHRKKHSILNESMPFEVFDDDKEDMKYVEVFLADNSYNPESVITDEENLTDFKSKLLDMLTPFEHEVLQLKSSGFDYKEIADMLEKDKKQVDNAIQRIRSKLKNAINSNK
ncbi:MAG: sigma-70 family RNA polymerase sigma factor [Bacilli bacterium]|nr:sigma-70 family RNA polymerase sigma factor [Bacilli bacterium]